MMKSAASCLCSDHELIPSVCDVEPSLPAPMPSPYAGIAITPTLSLPTLLTKLPTSVPAEIVIADLPSTQVCWAWYSSCEPISSFQPLSSIISWRFHHPSANSGSVNFLSPTTACLRSSIEVRDWLPMIAYSHPPNHPSLTPPAIGVMPFALSVSHAARN